MNFLNPLHYVCGANEADPHDLPARDLGDFLAYGFLVSYTDHRDTVCTITPEAICDLREGFLNCVENAVSNYAQFNPGNFIGCDPAQPTVTLSCPNDGCCDVAWRFDLVDADGELCFTLEWSGADEFSLWLSKEAIQDEKGALAIIGYARDNLAMQKDYVTRYDSRKP